MKKCMYSTHEKVSCVARLGMHESFDCRCILVSMHYNIACIVCMCVHVCLLCMCSVLFCVLFGHECECLCSCEVFKQPISAFQAVPVVPKWPEHLHKHTHHKQYLHILPLSKESQTCVYILDLCMY